MQTQGCWFSLRITWRGQYDLVSSTTSQAGSCINRNIMKLKNNWIMSRYRSKVSSNSSPKPETCKMFYAPQTYHLQFWWKLWCIDHLIRNIHGNYNDPGSWSLMDNLCHQHKVQVEHHWYNLGIELYFINTAGNHQHMWSFAPQIVWRVFIPHFTNNPQAII